MHDHPDRAALRQLLETASAPASSARWRERNETTVVQARHVWLRGLRLQLGIAALAASSVAVVSVGLAGHYLGASPQTAGGRQPSYPGAAALVSPSTPKAGQGASPVPVTPGAPTRTAPASASPVAPTSPSANAVPPATPSPTATPLPSPAFPKAPYVTLDGHGGVLISGSGDSYWGIAYSTSPLTNPSKYASPAIPASSSTFDYKVPAGYPPCISVEAIHGGNGYSGGTTGNWSRPIVCV
jgi:hypothetical protein